MNSSLAKERIHQLEKVKNIVVKVGSSTLTYNNGLLNLSHIEHLVRQLSDLHNKGYGIILVSSGAIGAGMGKLGLKEKPQSIPEKQAAAAVGQGILLHMYEKIFSEYGKTVGQILLTKEDMTDETRRDNAYNTFTSLLDKRVIPIINENDAVVVDEIKVGDNDTLSALVAKLVKADLLILMSDIDGLYDSDPRKIKMQNLLVL
ncbi:gamma-glutamyl kinase [Clostridium tetanomorphum]|nr:gamma-glutamyl kinase [Clostridium tetanomorphum]